MIISLIILIISFVLEIILNNFLPYSINDLSLFTPMFSIVSLSLIYQFLKKDKIKYLFISIILGIIYDFVFTNLLFFNAILFFMIALVVISFNKYLDVNCINLILEIILIIFLYEIMSSIIIILFNLVPMSFYRLFYKISHSLLINIIYGEIVLLIIRLVPGKYKKLSIN